jgi:hypothetical protein
MSDLGVNSDVQQYRGPEIWRPPPGFPPCYEISTHGRGRSRRVRVRNGRLGSKTIELAEWRILELAESANGYRYMTLRDHAGRQRTVGVHVQVMTTFVGPRPTTTHEVRHLDGNEQNNHVSNLCWGTREENAADKRRHREERKRIGAART